MKRFMLFSALVVFISCKSQNKINSVSEVFNYIDTNGQTITTRYLPPDGFKRIEYEALSYSRYVQDLKLKSIESLAKYYDGSAKPKEGVYSSVIDMEISPRDLQQCADATMRIRGEYLFHQEKYDSIHFNFLSDGKARYFIDYTTKRDYKSFRKYMDYVFAFANTTSLYDELAEVNSENVRAGDVLITKGRPYGHAILVLDVVEDSNGKKKVLFGQSYMPAQETQVLVNNNTSDRSPWYDVGSGKQIFTPEWTFEDYKIGRFK